MVQSVKILVSACLLGQAVRYDQSSKMQQHPQLLQWQQLGWLVPICPEVSAGLPIPRPPAEISAGKSGDAVLATQAQVITVQQQDVTESFVRGAQLALALAQQHQCRYAILTDGSPSCGSQWIYDGSFHNRQHRGVGVTAALLRRHGIEVFSQQQIAQLAKRLAQ